MDQIRKRVSVAIDSNRYRAHTRRIPGLLVLSPIFLILVGLLVLVAGSERSQAQAQGPARTVPAVKVAFIGDAGVNKDAKKVLDLIDKEGADFVLHQGDFAYGDEDAAAARDWNEQVNGILGVDFPYFGAVGNHDKRAWSTYQGLFQDRLNRNPDAVCQSGDGGYGVNTACNYMGIHFILSGVGTRGSGHVEFIQDQLTGDNSTWSICTWHKNQQAMQVGGKGNEVGWGAYESCREGGAIVATGHEHSYSRTKTLTRMRDQVVDPDWPDRNDLRVSPGSTFAFVSGLGGHTVRDQERCRPASYPYGCKGEWASIYSSDQKAKPGALFITFNFGGDPNQAQGQFIDVKGKIVDEFMITAGDNNTGPVVDDQPKKIGQGLKLSRNSDFSTTDTSFDYGETVYILAWSDQVDFNNIKKSEWKLEKMKGSLTNNHDRTYTGQVLVDEKVKKVKEGESSRGQVEIKIEDRNGRKFKTSQSVTLNGPEG